MRQQLKQKTVIGMVLVVVVGLLVILFYAKSGSPESSLFIQQQKSSRPAFLFRPKYLQLSDLCGFYINLDDSLTQTPAPYSLTGDAYDVGGLVEVRKIAGGYLKQFFTTVWIPIAWNNSGSMGYCDTSGYPFLSNMIVQYTQNKHVCNDTRSYVSVLVDSRLLTVLSLQKQINC